MLSSQFIGKKVFLNVSGCNETSAKIKRFLSECGAHSTEFLDKSVDAIIVDKRMRREKLSTPSNASQSRASRMINATSGKVKLGSSSFEEISKRWNIPIYDSKMLLKGCQLQHSNIKVERTAHKTSKVRKLKAPFIKVEDRSHKYRVDFVEMQTVHFLIWIQREQSHPLKLGTLKMYLTEIKENLYQQQPANYAKEPIMILTVIWFLQDTQQQQRTNHVSKTLIN